jgi:hypothetical protein
VFIVVSNVYVTQVGPFFDYSSCSSMEQIIKKDIAESMENDFPYGMSMDKWDIGHGAIYRLQDYYIACDRETILLK